MELIARVKSQLRRYIELNPGKPVEDDMIRVRNLVIDTKRHIVSIDDKPITLTRIEFNILQLLARHPGRVFSVDEIYENVWSDKFYEANNTVMVHIRRLREKIEDNPKKPKTIITVWGVGYKIEG
jgi:DNA-binding response OmpR family regulator